MTPLLEVLDLRKYFPVQRGVWQRTKGFAKAVDGVSFVLERAKTLGLVGESGCGKTTLARTIVRLTEPSSGSVFFDGQELTALDSKELRKLRPRMQMVFQDPFGSLNPRMRVGDSIGEPLLEHRPLSRVERRDRVSELMQLVGLDGEWKTRYPHEFSGGQRQRIGLARALALQPELIVCDEPISALDVSIQAQIVNLLKDIQAQFGLAYLFISHDLGMVRHLCDEVAVMYLGKIMEYGSAEAIFDEPRHPYTQALLASIPRLDARTIRSERPLTRGEVPSPTDPPPGCRFSTRCPLVEARCREETPELRELDGTRAACHLL